MVDRMLASPCHIIVTMRTKTEYQEQVNQSTGKKQRVKIGLAPVQRDGLEYEFDLVSYMDEENTFITDKTRCPFFKKKAITEPKATDLQPFVDWLKGAKAPEKLSLEQATALFNKAKDKKISNESLLARLNIDRLGSLPVSRLKEAEDWIAAQPIPVDPAVAKKAYQSEVEAYIRLGVSTNALADYVETLPFAGDLAAVAAHLKNKRETTKPEGLIASMSPAAAGAGA